MTSPNLQRPAVPALLSLALVPAGILATVRQPRFQEDQEIATSCEKEFRFGVRTPAHLAAMQLGLLASGDDEDVVLHGCPIP